MGSGEPGEEDRKDIFGGAKRHVGEWFRRRRDAGAQRSLAGMRRKCYTGGERDAGNVPLRGKVGAGGVGDHGGYGDPNERVEGIPYEIEVGNLVGEEFEDKQGCGDSDDPPLLKRMEVRGQVDSVKTPEKAERCDRR